MKRLMLLLFLVAWATSVAGAPAPLPRRDVKRQSWPVGAWVSDDGSYRVVLGPDGVAEELWHREHLVRGRWQKIDEGYVQIVFRNHRGRGIQEILVEDNGELWGRPRGLGGFAGKLEPIR